MKAGTVSLLDHQSLVLSISLGLLKEIIKSLLNEWVNEWTKPIDSSDLVSFPEKATKPFRRQEAEEGGNYHNNACPSQSVKVIAESIGCILDASLPLLIPTLFQRGPGRKPLQRSLRASLCRTEPHLEGKGEWEGEERKEIGIYWERTLFWIPC